MVNKLNPKSIPNHNQTHKEFYEPKLEMMICGCGNRRLLTEDERLQYGLDIITEKSNIQIRILTPETFIKMFSSKRRKSR